MFLHSNPSINDSEIKIKKHNNLPFSCCTDMFASQVQKGAEFLAP